jgi:prolyl 4-hydroxylase
MKTHELATKDSSDDGSDSSWEDLNYDNDEDDENTSFQCMLRSELQKNWKQHSVAVLIALFATAAYAYKHHAITTVKMYAFLTSPTTNLNLQSVSSTHAHLEKFQRTANISFCNGTDIIYLAQGGGELERMDFNLPKHLIPALELHYAADRLQDDDYSLVLSQGVQPKLRSDHTELHCVERLREESTKSSIKGYTFFYKSPNISSIYPQVLLSSANNVEPVQVKSAALSFTGFAAKFFNLSPDPILLYWDGKAEQYRRLVGEIAPFESLGTATTPGQSFSVSPVHDATLALERWVLTADECLVFYEPKVTENLSDEQYKLYQMQKLNQEFAKHYHIASGRSWLAQFPSAFAKNHFWEANRIGREHVVQTDTKTYHLKVESAEPRVFSLQDFLSHEECDQLIEMATRQGMKQSNVYSGSLAKHQRDSSTRSSSNTWLERSFSELTDQIYRQAAQILQMDESLLQAPIDDNIHFYRHSIAESLQVVRYKLGEEYTPHHDWTNPSQRHRLQPTRFATLLLYLNDDFEGGQTVFPRATNVEFHEAEKGHGCAIL